MVRPASASGPRNLGAQRVARTPRAAAGLTTALLAVSVLLLSGCRSIGELETSFATTVAADEAAWQLAGRSVEEVREVAAFDSLQVTGGISVSLRVARPDSASASAPTVRIAGDAAHVALVRSEVDDGQLTLGLQTASPGPAHRLAAQVVVTGPAPDEISVGDRAVVRVEGFAADRLTVDVWSVGELELDGRVELLSAHISGGSTLRARALEAREVVVEGSTGAEGSVFAQRSLAANLSGGASLCFVGADPATAVDSSTGARFGRCEDE